MAEVIIKVDLRGRKYRIPKYLSNRFDYVVREAEKAESVARTARSRDHNDLFSEFKEFLINNKLY